jgi:hypothetical protein
MTLTDEELQQIIDAKKAHVESGVVLWNMRLKLLRASGNDAAVAEHLTAPVEALRNSIIGGFPSSGSCVVS